MDIMKLTRELGRALQQDQTYINMSVAEQQCNEDEALQHAIGELNLQVSASLGVTLFPPEESNMEAILKLADGAMYQAKAAGRNQIRFAAQ